MKMKLNNLQILRAFAALNVVVFHIIGTSESYGFDVNYLKPLAGWGSNGVDIFFVLSGFIMVYIQAGRTSNPIDFLADRFTRIVPLYLLLTVVLFCLINGLPQFSRSQPVEVRDLAASIFFVSGGLLNRYPVLFNGWTLEFEMFFYLLIAIALFFRNQVLAFVTVILIISFSIIFLSLSLVAFEFLFGVFVGYLYLNTKKNKNLSMISIVIGTGLLLMPILVLPTGALSQRVIMSGVPAMFIIYGLSGIHQRREGFLTAIGDASYSIYLAEVFTLPLFYKVAGFISLSEKIPNDILATLCFVFTAAVGWCMYHTVERPLTKGVRNILKRGTHSPLPRATAHN